MKMLSMPTCLAAAALATMGGCATQKPSPASWRIEPVMQVRHSAQDSESYYRTGRYFDGMQSWDRAIEAYRKSIAADPQNVEAHNALGVALAQRGRYESAEEALRHALTLDPSRAHVRSNLGYVLLLAGKLPEAVTELKGAVGRDAASEVARENLEQALAWSGEMDDAGGAASPPSAAHATPSAIESPTRDEPHAPPLQVIDRATVAQWPTMHAATAQPMPSGPADTPEALPERISSRLELSNGSGERGAADRLRRWLTGQGTVVQRLTNQKPYVQQQTVIQYRPGHRSDADRLATMLPFSPATQLVADLDGELRMVIGHDWKHVAACLEGGCGLPVQLAAAEPAP